MPPLTCALVEKLQTIADPRRQGENLKHPLVDVIMLGFCGVLATPHVMLAHAADYLPPPNRILSRSLRSARESRSGGTTSGAMGKPRFHLFPPPRSLLFLLFMTGKGEGQCAYAEASNE